MNNSGRSMHKNGVYIPQPRLPDPRKHKVQIAQPPPRKPTPAVHLHRSSVIINVSESEGEEVISEADRDARLAYVNHAHDHDRKNLR